MIKIKSYYVYNIILLSINNFDFFRLYRINLKKNVIAILLRECMCFYYGFNKELKSKEL